MKKAQEYKVGSMVQVRNTGKIGTVIARSPNGGLHISLRNGKAVSLKPMSVMQYDPDYKFGEEE